ncbi:caspase family protein [Pseudanabaenaceae cyanobacterium LEGE 13415]|nr:caspase family protein [Pseudanabaenaceae cyanobacterium LEGE 13415]
MQSTLKTGQATLWVLLVGVNQYHDRRFPTLQYSTIDTQRLAEAFADVTQEFPQKSIQVYHDYATEPTLDAVRSSLEAIVSQAKPEDTVVFYFCGHGALDPQLQQAVLCLSDTQKDAMLRTGLSAIKLLGMMGSCAAKHQILWIDVCHANGMTAQSETPELLDSPIEQLVQMFRQQAAQNLKFQALLSCDAKQQSWKFPELGHGIFSHFLIEGLRGAAANPQGVVTASVLANYVHDRTVQYIDRTNQQLTWLHRDTENRPSKAIVQTPARIAQSQTQTVLGIKPQDPLELLFPNIKAENIDPPLDRSASLVKPKVDIPPPIEKPSSIEPAIPLIQKIVPESIVSKAEEPVIERSIHEDLAIESHVVEADSHSVEEAVSEPIELANEDPIPLIETSELESDLEEADLSIQEKISQPIDPETPLTEDFLETHTIQETISQPINPETSLTEDRPEIQENVSQSIEPEISLDEEVTTGSRSSHIQESISKPVEPVISPIQEPIPQAIVKPIVRRKRNNTQRQIKRLKNATQKQLKQTATTLSKATQAAGEFASTQHAQSKQRAAELQDNFSARLNEFNRFLHQVTSSGQAVYRQRTTEASHITVRTIHNVDRSTRNLSQSAFEHTQKPESRRMMMTGLKVFGVVAVAVTGVGLYQWRNEQIQAVQQLSSAAATQLESGQPSAFSSALKAGRKLQEVDRPWNFVPQSLRISTAATLQQAIAFSEMPTTPVGVSLSNATLSPDQRTFAVSTRDNTIQLWQRNGEKLQQLGTGFKGHKGAITHLVFSPDGKRLASASQDKTIKLWDVEKGILIQTLSAHTQAVTALSFRSDGEVLASGSADQTIKLWSVSQGKILDTFKGHNAIASVIRFSPDGRILAAGMLDNSIHLWYPDSQNPVRLGSHDQPSDKPQGITDLAFTPDGKTIASAGSDDTIKLWTVGNANSERDSVPNQTLSGHENTVTSLSFSADGQILASGGRDRTIRLWNMQNGSFIKTLVGSQDPIEQIAFGADSKALLSVGNRYGLRTWNLDLNRLIESACRVTSETPPAECF